MNEQESLFNFSQWTMFTVVTLDKNGTSYALK